MIKTLQLSESQHLLWDRLCDDRAVLEAREARILASMLQELGGKLNEPWQFERTARVFWMNIPDAVPTEDGRGPEEVRG